MVANSPEFPTAQVPVATKDDVAAVHRRIDDVHRRIDDLRSEVHTGMLWMRWGIGLLFVLMIAMLTAFLSGAF